MPQDQEIDHWKYTLGRVLIFCLICALVLVIGSPLTRGLGRPLSETILAAGAIIVVFLFTILFVRWEALRLSDVGVIPGRLTVSHVLIGFLIGLFLAGFHVALMLVYGHIKLTRLPEISFATLLINLLLYFLLAAREELAFRGYPLRSLAYSMRGWKAQIIVAVIFSLEHVAGGYSWTQAFFGAGVGAILFGIAALKTKGIALPIGLHAAWNFGQWCAGFKSDSGLWQVTAEKGFQEKQEQASLIAYLIVMALAIASFYFYHHRWEHRQ